MLRKNRVKSPHLWTGNGSVPLGQAKTILFLEQLPELRRKLAGLSDLEATKTVVEMIRRFSTNELVLDAIQGGM